MYFFISLHTAAAQASARNWKAHAPTPNQRPPSKQVSHWARQLFAKAGWLPKWLVGAGCRDEPSTWLTLWQLSKVVSSNQAKMPRQKFCSVPGAWILHGLSLMLVKNSSNLCFYFLIGCLSTTDVIKREQEIFLSAYCSRCSIQRPCRCPAPDIYTTRRETRTKFASWCTAIGLRSPGYYINVCYKHFSSG